MKVLALPEVAPARAALVASSVLLSLVLLRALTSSKTAEPSKPKTKDGAPLFEPPSAGRVLGSMLEIARNAGRFHDWIGDVTALAGGKPWLLRALGRPDIVVVSTPELFEDVQKTQFDSFGKGPYVHELTRDLAGNAIVLVDGPLWAFQRKVSVNLFSARLLRESMASVIHKNTLTLDRILDAHAQSGGELFDLSRLMYQFTMEVFTEIGFGLQLGALGNSKSHAFESALDEATVAVSKRSRLPTPVWKLMRALNVGSERELRECIKIIDENVMGIIAKTMEAHQRGDAPGRADLVSLFLEHSASEKGDYTVDAKLLKDIALNMLVAGRDTSAEAMCWFLYCLSTRPDVEAKVRAEILEKLPELASGATPFVPVDALQGLVYLEAALKESLRLFPLFAFVRRVAFEDVELSDGTFVPQGTYVAMAPFTMARRTDVWGEDAAEYNPERFLDPATGKLRQVSIFKFNSFWAGPRSCVGMKLAMLEMKTVLAKVLARFRFEIDPANQPDGRVTYRMSLTLPIKDGLRVRVARLPADATVA